MIDLSKKRKGQVMIADFGLSKERNDQVMTRYDDTIVFDIPNFDLSKEWTYNDTLAYIDPKFLADNKYQRDEKLDVYSFGVLLWEISSGRPPFAYGRFTIEVIIMILKGMREKQVEGTPKEYIDLYTRCWDEEPSNRPSIQE
ncbi:kinase-like domain-containing protein, partial [Gigaspora rosea]